MIKRKDGRYQEAITINGKRKFFYGTTRAEVLRKIADYAEEQERAVLFKTVAEDWERQHREDIGEKTWINYRPHYNDIVERHGDRPISDITALDVSNDLKRCHAEKRSATIINTRRSIYKMILDHAVFQGHISVNPATNIPMPKGAVRGRREAPDVDVLPIILNNTDKPFGLFPALLALTGLRKAEALALTWGDIHSDHISVTKALDYTNHSKPVLKAPKTKAGIRDVPIMDALKPLLKRPAGATSDALLFPGSPSNRNPNAGGHMTERQYEGAWNRYCAAVGLVDSDGKPTLTAHQLRHGMATLGFEAGVDQLTMQAILGHASPTTTRNIYTHLRKQKLAQDTTQLNTAVSKLLSKAPEAAEIKEK